MNKIILTVDDSASMRGVIRMFLTQAGYTVIEAADGQAGLQQAMAHAVSLIITDQNMPTMDGVTLVKKLRELPKYKTVPILMLTTESSPELMSQGRSAGASGWLVKPFNGPKLVEVVNKMIG